MVNEGTMIVGKPYLKNYVMCYDNSLPKESRPIIAKISQTQFKEALIKANTCELDNLVAFGRTIPGIQNLTKKQSKILF